MSDCLASALGALAVVLFVTPAILIIAVPLTFGYLRVQNLYIATNRELKRLDSIALSPIFSKFSETLSGLITLRAFKKQAQFAEQNKGLIDQSNRAWWPMQVSKCCCCLSFTHTSTFSFSTEPSDHSVRKGSPTCLLHIARCAGSSVLAYKTQACCMPAITQATRVQPRTASAHTLYSTSKNLRPKIQFIKSILAFPQHLSAPCRS